MHRKILRAPKNIILKHSSIMQTVGRLSLELSSRCIAPRLTARSGAGHLAAAFPQNHLFRASSRNMSGIAVGLRRSNDID